MNSFDNLNRSSSAYTVTHVTTICPRCGMAHLIQQCPQVKAIEYHEDGSIKRVEFMTASDYMTIRIEPSIKPPYEITVLQWLVQRGKGGGG